MLKFLLNVLFLFCCSGIYSSSLQQIITHAKEGNRPILMAFLGPEDCPWSSLLQKNVLHDPVFLEKMEGEILLYEVTFEERALREEYKVNDLPSLLLLDPKGKEFARMGFLSLSATEYVRKIHTLIDDFQQICCEFNQTKQPFDENKLQTLYTKACALSVNCYQNVILSRGLKKEKGVFFHLERYALLLKELPLKHPLVIEFKKQLLKRKNVRNQDLLFSLALLEFQAELGKKRVSQKEKKVIRPLLRYLKESKNGQERWKAYLLVGEYLFSHHQPFIAFSHLKRAHDLAPEEKKEEIQAFLNLIAGPN